MADDYYKELGVSRSATEEEIQKAYRKLARKYHPDLHADKSEKEKEEAKQKFQQIQHAYDVLNDAEKRKMYDQFGANFEQMGAAGNPFQGGGAPFGQMDVDFSQIFGGAGGQQGSPGGFEEILRQFSSGGQGGHQSRRQAPQPVSGQNMEYEITVPFHVAVLGGEHVVSLRKQDGTTDSITVKIPAGIESGKKIRLRGQGQPGAHGGSSGDLLIKVNVTQHPVFKRQGLNLSVELPVTVVEAVDGAKIDLPTPHGTVTVTVPSGTSSGKLLRLKGMGIKTDRAAGDLLAEVQIHIPSQISATDREKINGLGGAWHDRAVRKQLKW
ncbi:MAG: J domain-containing protein [Mariniblastus sp.]|nr:J domain-containing protein [Mariniblastus sp.]